MKTAFLNEKRVKSFFLIFYTVGLAGLLYPATFKLFTCLIPWCLLLNVLCLSMFHRGTKDMKTLAILLLILVSATGVEIAGVNTACVFGQYRYGESLGIKVYNTPLIIGLNWLFLTYTTASVLEGFKIPVSVKIAGSSFLMVFYDILLENVAPKLGMWDWNNGVVPIRNYIVWFVLAVTYHSLIKFSGVKTRNPLSLVILASQFVFFTVLAFFIR